MATELVPYTQVESMATAVARSRLFKAFDTPERALVLMMIAQAEGYHPMQAMQRYDIIEGKPAKKGDAMMADFQARGGKVEWVKMSDTEVTGVFHAPGLISPVSISWTLEMAARAGLAGKQTWKGYPRAMLRARVISEGIRTAMPGVVAGLYTPEEVQDFDSGMIHVSDGVSTDKPRVAVDQPVSAHEADVTVEPASPSEPPAAQDNGASKQHARTKSHAAATPKASVTEVQKLSQALVKAQIGTCFDPDMTEAEQHAEAKKARLNWVNMMLEDAGAATVSSALELTAQQCRDLTEDALAGRSPKGM